MLCSPPTFWFMTTNLCDCTNLQISMQPMQVFWIQQFLPQFLWWKGFNNFIPTLTQFLIFHLHLRQEKLADGLTQPEVTGPRTLQPEVFHGLCHRWGTSNVYLLVSKFNNKRHRFISKYSGPLVEADHQTISLVAPWDHQKPDLCLSSSNTSSSSNPQNQDEGHSSDTMLDWPRQML